jgi:CheY-like chemotaxis protein
MTTPSAKPSAPAVATLLVADPSEEVRRTVAAAARKTMPGARLLEARTGPEALALLRSESCDAVVIDVAMPVMSGVEVIGAARKEGVRPFLILTSAVVLPNWAVLSTDLYAYEFMKKPFFDEDIEALLANFERMRRPIRALVADANEQTRTMVRKVLGGCHFRFEFQETDNGGHALKLARLKPFDVAFIDAHLNGIGGLETACQLQSSYKDTTVITILPATDGGLAQSLKHLGLEQSLRKPFFARDVDLLLHTVHGMRRPYLMNAMRKNTAANTAANTATAALAG